MILLPKRLGSFTLTRKLGTGGVSETFLGTQDAGGERPVVVRYILPYIQRDPTRLAAIEARIRDLLGVRHPFLVHVFDHVVDGEDRYVVEEHIEGIPLDRVLQWCRQTHRHIPHNIFLNIATQICNGLEALHGRTGKGSSAEHVLHLGLKPGAIFLTREGKVVVGSYGLVRSPTALPHGGVAGPVPTRMDYLSPEQTHPDQKLTPASDIFALAAVLYEMITLESLFRADSNLQTIHRIRRSEVTTQLLRVKELMPGLDKILFRALSLNPHHRYRRAFVLREDLRGLMAGYSFSSIAEDTRSFLAPLLENQEEPAHPPVVDAAPPPPPLAASLILTENTETTDIRGFQEPLSSETLSPPPENPAPEPTVDPTVGGGEEATEPDNTLFETAPPPARPPVFDADDEFDDWVPEASGASAVPPMPPPEAPQAWKLPRKKRTVEEEDEARSVFSDVADPTATSFTQLP
ncbi:MAG TPA: serine/threonine-protein kinase, partial [Myxococcota bacterium]|nr:serine/threonine-protein kinase [Myxococcota bacterium]